MQCPCQSSVYGLSQIARLAPQALAPQGKQPRPPCQCYLQYIPQYQYIPLMSPAFTLASQGEGIFLPPRTEYIPTLVYAPTLSHPALPRVLSSPIYIPLSHTPLPHLSPSLIYTPLSPVCLISSTPPHLIYIPFLMSPFFSPSPSYTLSHISPSLTYVLFPLLPSPPPSYIFPSSCPPSFLPPPHISSLIYPPPSCMSYFLYSIPPPPHIYPFLMSPFLLPPISYIPPGSQRLRIRASRHHHPPRSTGRRPGRRHRKRSLHSRLHRHLTHLPGSPIRLASYSRTIIVPMAQKSPSQNRRTNSEIGALSIVQCSGERGRGSVGGRYGESAGTDEDFFGDFGDGSFVESIAQQVPSSPFFLLPSSPFHPPLPSSYSSSPPPSSPIPYSPFSSLLLLS